MDKLPTPNEFFKIDEELANASVSAFDRPRAAAHAWSVECNNPALEFDHEVWFRDRYKVLHPSVPYDSHAFLTLCVSARAISYFIKPPFGYGRVFIKPLDYVAITQNERARIWNEHPDSFWEMAWQGLDAIDLFMAHINYHSQSIPAMNMMKTAINQLTASARQLVSCEVDSSLPQGMAMACELAGKSLLLHRGLSEKFLKSLSHDLTLISREVSKELPSPADFEVNNVARVMPQYVSVRYNSPSMTISEAQDIYRKALFIIADFLRRISPDQVYWKAMSDPAMPSRQW